MTVVPTQPKGELKERDEGAANTKIMEENIHAKINKQSVTFMMDFYSFCLPQ
jgi:hypothetical protein